MDRRGNTTSTRHDPARCRRSCAGTERRRDRHHVCLRPRWPVGLDDRPRTARRAGSTTISAASLSSAHPPVNVASATTPPISSSSSSTVMAPRRSNTTHAVVGCAARGAADIGYVWNDRRLEAIVVDGTLHRFTIDENGSLRRGRRAHDRLGRHPRHAAGRRRSTAKPRITVDAVRRQRRRYGVRWGPFELADAWGESSDLADGWHPYFGVASEGIVWLRARPYDVATCQFLAPDPLAAVPGKPGSVSSYTYAANDPINLFDPTGHQPISIEAFNDIRDRRTGVQWQNIASAAIAVAAVAVTVATLGTAGPVAMVLGGAAIGALAGGRRRAQRVGGHRVRDEPRRRRVQRRGDRA